MLPTIDFLMLQLRMKGIWQKRSLGQHFLADPELLEQIAALAGADGETAVVEIGPGAGVLTTCLARTARAVVAVEFDSRLAPVHRDAFGQAPNVRFVYGDALRLDLHALAREAMAASGASRAILAGNLPYQITSPLFFGQCRRATPWQRMCVMIQREVADRITAEPGGKAFGILAAKLGCWWRTTARLEVGAEHFFPRPKVDGTVLVLEPAAEADQPPDAEWASLSGFIEAAFGQRRKMLVNSLAARWPEFTGKEAVLAALERMGVSAQIRAEALSLAQLRRLHGLLLPGA